MYCAKILELEEELEELGELEKEKTKRIMSGESCSRTLWLESPEIE